MATKVTKEMILNTAFSLMKEKGCEAVTVRNIAESLGVSTQPIYSQYKSSSQLFEDVYEKANNEFIETIISSIDENDFLYSFSLSYVRVAKENANLFKFIFFEYYKQNLSRENIYSVLVEQYLKNKESFGKVLSLYKINEEGMKRVSRRLLTYVHGEAVYTLYEKNSFENVESAIFLSDLRQTINEMLRGEIMRQNFGI